MQSACWGVTEVQPETGNSSILNYTLLLGISTQSAPFPEVAPHVNISMCPAAVMRRSRLTRCAHSKTQWAACARMGSPGFEPTTARSRPCTTAQLFSAHTLTASMLRQCANHPAPVHLRQCISSPRAMPRGRERLRRQRQGCLLQHSGNQHEA